MTPDEYLKEGGELNVRFTYENGHYLLAVTTKTGIPISIYMSDAGSFQALMKAMDVWMSSWNTIGDMHTISYDGPIEDIDITDDEAREHQAGGFFKKDLEKLDRGYIEEDVYGQFDVDTDDDYYIEFEMEDDDDD